MKTQTIVEQAGGTKYVAEQLGLTYQAVYQWNQVPAKYVYKLAKMSKLKPQQIREDMFA